MFLFIIPDSSRGEIFMTSSVQVEGSIHKKSNPTFQKWFHTKLAFNPCSEVYFSEIFDSYNDYCTVFNGTVPLKKSVFSSVLKQTIDTVFQGNVFRIRKSRIAYRGIEVLPNDF